MLIQNVCKKKKILRKATMQNYIKSIITKLLNYFVLIIDSLCQLKSLLVVIVLKNLLNGVLNKKSIVIKQLTNILTKN